MASTALPFESFERYAPFTTADDVAEFFAPYQQAGLRRFNLPPCAGSTAESIELAGEVKKLLERS
jgi:hypothetical protein